MRDVRGLAALMLVAATAAVPAQSATPPSDSQRPLTWELSPTQRATLFPAGDVYEVYVADMHRPTNAVIVGFYSRTRIPQSGSPRTFLAGGGRFGMLRFDRLPSGRSWQVSFDTGLDALFDSKYKNDDLGWDGNYGLTLTTASSSSRLGLKFAVLHISAHIGDEYSERSGTKRINYTREEVALGAMWRLRPRLRAYGEAGYAYRMRSDGQEKWRWQSGLEYETRPTVFGGRMAWFGAVDFSSLEERDWRLDTSIQGGLVARSSGHAYRLFAGWYDGRPTMGQFTQYSEASFLTGLKLDF